MDLSALKRSVDRLAVLVLIFVFLIAVLAFGKDRDLDQRVRDLESKAMSMYSDHDDIVRLKKQMEVQVEINKRLVGVD